MIKKEKAQYVIQHKTNRNEFFVFDTREQANAVYNDINSKKEYQIILMQEIQVKNPDYDAYNPYISPTKSETKTVVLRDDKKINSTVYY